MNKDNKDIKDNRIELLEEDIECVHTYLDGLNIPRQCDGVTFSIVGRINILEVNYLLRLSKLESHYLNSQSSSIK